MEVSCLLLGVILVLSAENAGAVGMKIAPKRASTHKNGSAEIMCDLKRSATQCTFNVRYVDYYYDENRKDIQLIDLDRGSAAGTFERPNTRPLLFKAKYHGTGLQDGQCGIKMFNLTPGMYFVGCRVRTASSGWTYDYMALVVHNSTGTERAAKKTDNMADFEMVNVEEKKNSPPINFPVNLTSRRDCRLLLPNGGLLLVKASNISENKDAHLQVKWRVSASNVSLTLRNVTSGGVAWCLCRDSPEADYTEFDVKIVTKLKAPTNVITELSERPGTNFTEGEILTATCVAKYARPVAKIVWKLGDDVIRNDTVDDNKDEAELDRDPNDKSDQSRGAWPWRWPWNTKSIKQDLHYKLTLNNSGAILTCQVSHPAIVGGSWTSFSSVITVNASSTPITPDAHLWYAVVGLLVLVAIVAGVAFFWCRRTRGAGPKAGQHSDRTSFTEENDLYQAHNDPRLITKHALAGQHSDRTSFTEENDLYQAHNDPRLINKQALDLRATIQAENPYEELNIVPTAGNPSSASSNHQSPTYGNTVQYAEVTIGPRNDSKPPPRKPADSEACVYAEVMKKTPPKR